MMNMKLSFKLFAGFLAGALAIAFLSGYTIFQMKYFVELQHTTAQRARDAEIATEASFVGVLSYSIMADAVINGKLDETRKDWTEQKKKNQELLQQVRSTLDTDEERSRFKKAEDNYNEMVKHFEDELLPILMKDRNAVTISEVDAEIDSHKKMIREELHAISLSLIKETDRANEEFDGKISRLIAVSLFLALFCGMGALLAGFLITRSITKPLNRIIDGLRQSAAQVGSASGEISASSQQLAEGASQQAAAVEETSSSLEEMSSMTRQNADNSRQANDLMKSAVEVVGRANRSMTELTTSMDSITRASEETQKIIKTIDEIAFQTNLLALNAAVEAARAGEAGAGFAVVADEVRNLAMRAAEAAKNTAALIEGTVKEIRQGSDIAGRTNTDFNEVSIGIGKVGELVGEITAASQEQAQGIEQINKAVSEMDKVTQQNAATAEESASASEEMSAQADNLQNFVSELSMIVGSGSGARTGASSTPARRVIRTSASVEKKVRPRPGGSPKALPRSKEIPPDKMIPFDDDDF